jgi:hypothetical protein
MTDDGEGLRNDGCERVLILRANFVVAGGWLEHGSHEGGWAGSLIVDLHKVAGRVVIGSGLAADHGALVNLRIARRSLARGQRTPSQPVNLWPVVGGRGRAQCLLLTWASSRHPGTQGPRLGQQYAPPSPQQPNSLFNLADI